MKSSNKCINSIVLFSFKQYAPVSLLNSKMKIKSVAIIASYKAYNNAQNETSYHKDF